MTLGRNDAPRSLRAWMATRYRQLAYEVAVRLLDRIGKGPALDDRRRAWLIEELEADLSDQIEDLRVTGTVPSELGAREMVVTRAVIGWLRNGDDPGPCASRFLRMHQELRRPWQGGSDRVAEAAYAAALADLRDGDVVPSVKSLLVRARISLGEAMLSTLCFPFVGAALLDRAARPAPA